MTLERRDGCTYYYRSVRDGDKVRKVYMGAGELARIAHERETCERALEEHRREEERRELERLQDLSAPVLEVEHAAKILTRAHLIVAGCHRHKGEWRRARGEARAHPKSA